ncbi:MAG: thioredoxin family protein [Thermoanaerobaculia bacterium]
MAGPLAAALLAALAAGPAAATPEGGWLTSVDEALAVAGGEDRYVLVDLYAEWCGWCKELERQVLETPEFRRWAEDFVLLWVDVEDGGQGSELQARFGATSLPTTLVLAAAGGGEPVKVGEVMGFHPTGRFIAALEAEIAAYGSLIELYDRVRRSPEVRRRDDSALRLQLAEDFHQRGDGLRAAVLYEQLLAAVTGGAGGAAAWLHYQAADARRLGGELGAAENHLERARVMVRTLGDGDLSERLDLLSFQIAGARGDCHQMMTSLEMFLANHPRSPHSRHARRTLEEIRESGGSKC